MKLLFLTHGDRQTGLGHVYRSMALAEVAQARSGHTVCFATQENTDGYKILSRRFMTTGIDPKDHMPVNLYFVPDVVIFDMKGAIPSAMLEAYDRWHNYGTFLCSLAGLSTGMTKQDHFLDMTFVQGAWNLSHTGYIGGFEYSIIRPSLLSWRMCTNVTRQDNTIFAFLGSYDPMNLMPSITAIAAEHRCSAYGAEGGFEYMDAAMSKAQYAVTRFGMTTLELCCLGIPQVTITDDEVSAKSASALAELGAVRHIHVTPQMNREGLLRQISLELTQIRRHGGLLMENCARNVIDGLGAWRVLEKIEGYRR